MSKEQKDLELKANELGNELDDDEIEAASGGVGYNCDCISVGTGIKEDPNNDPFKKCLLSGNTSPDYPTDKSCFAAGFGGDDNYYGPACQCTRSGQGYTPK
jgi:hypothetical protein